MIKVSELTNAGELDLDKKMRCMDRQGSTYSSTIKSGSSYWLAKHQQREQY